jgi:N-acetylglucosaminyldiphosphoundecaprenol N-acetyl-beta-D-mannosaminyltransferase
MGMDGTRPSLYPRNQQPSVSVMGVRIDLMTAPEVREACLSGQLLGLVVTPNAHGIIQANGNAAMMQTFQAAEYSFCDSRIVQLLASLVGVKLPLVTGSDLTRELFDDPRIRNLRVCVIGGQPWYGDALRKKYGCQALHQVDFPYQKHFTDEEIERICRAIPGDYDLCFVCLGDPLQSRVATTLQRLDRGRFPLLLCIGASVDFILGAKKRAPKLLQRLHMEWLFRLATEPRRLYRRYLVEDIQIFALFFRWARMRAREGKAR